MKSVTKKGIDDLSPKDLKVWNVTATESKGAFITDIHLNGKKYLNQLLSFANDRMQKLADSQDKTDQQKKAAIEKLISAMRWANFRLKECKSSHNRKAEPPSVIAKYEPWRTAAVSSSSGLPVVSIRSTRVNVLFVFVTLAFEKKQPPEIYATLKEMMWEHAGTDSSDAIEQRTGTVSGDIDTLLSSRALSDREPDVWAPVDDLTSEHLEDKKIPSDSTVSVGSDIALPLAPDVIETMPTSEGWESLGDKSLKVQDKRRRGWASPAFKQIKSWSRSTPLTEGNLPKLSSENTIPEYTLATLIDSLIQTQGIDIIDSDNSVYFIPDSIMQAILKQGIHWLNAGFITEKVILDNMPINLQHFGGYFETVFRVNHTRYLEKREQLSSDGTAQRIELVMSVDSRRRKVGSDDFKFVPHSLDDLREAMKIVEWDEGEWSLNMFYHVVNKGDEKTRRTLVKWHILVLPKKLDIQEVIAKWRQNLRVDELKKSMWDLRWRKVTLWEKRSELEEALSSTVSKMDQNTAHIAQMWSILEEQKIQIQSIASDMNAVLGQGINMNEIDFDGLRKIGTGVLLKVQDLLWRIDDLQSKAVNNVGWEITILEAENAQLAQTQINLQNDLETLDNEIHQLDLQLGQFQLIVNQKIAELTRLLEE
jgi:hypothetical protein